MTNPTSHEALQGLGLMSRGQLTEFAESHGYSRQIGSRVFSALSRMGLETEEKISGLLLDSGHDRTTSEQIFFIGPEQSSGRLVNANTVNALMEHNGLGIIPKLGEKGIRLTEHFIEERKLDLGV